MSQFRPPVTSTSFSSNQDINGMTESLKNMHMEPFSPTYVQPQMKKEEGKRLHLSGGTLISEQKVFLVLMQLETQNIVEFTDQGTLWNMNVSIFPINLYSNLRISEYLTLLLWSFPINFASNIFNIFRYFIKIEQHSIEVKNLIYFKFL